MIEPKNATPSEIVKYLDEYVIGQDKAKRSIALALRTRYRRMQLPKDLQDEVVPKNILMIGSTGVGKTEIARRLAKIMNFPFIKVEASKYTEVGFVGRDVESMIRDLVSHSYKMVEKELLKKEQINIEKYVLNKIVDQLLPPPPKQSSTSEETYQKLRDKMMTRVINGEMDDKKIKIDPLKTQNTPEIDDFNGNVDIIKIQDSITSVLGSFNQGARQKEVTVKQAKELLKFEAKNEILDKNSIKEEALRRAENEGIIFIDEVDKIATGSSGTSRNDPSKEGVQRDLLPIVEGSTVNTKYGQVSTDHILFIAAGAFHVSKPSDLIPELQGRFPIRVELENITEEILYKILTQPKNSILKQYKALLEVENVTLNFTDEAIRSIAKIAQIANEKSEDIGARRLHTVVEKVVEKISFEAEKYKNQTIEITKELVEKELSDIYENEDIAHYIL
jgi:ATP-dependent HslUV protease ATP-binding subunit HslU